MLTKKTMAMLLVGALIVMASVNLNEALSECAKDCMPVCLRVEGATIPVCGQSCEEYCKQLGGGAGGDGDGF